MKALIAALGLFLAFQGGCGSPLGGNSSPKHYSFVVVVHNLDVAYAETCSITWWQDGRVTGKASKVMPAGGEAAFAIPGPFPEGFELDTVAWPEQSGGAVWQSPEYAGARIFHVSYPTRYAWAEVVLPH